MTPLPPAPSILLAAFLLFSQIIAQPVRAMNKEMVDDPHGNGSFSIDGEGHLWVLVSGRGNKRPGVIYRSKAPCEISE